MSYFWGALAGLVWGALCALLNRFITKKCLEKGTQKALMLNNAAHFAVDIAALAVVYFLRSLLPFSFEAMLIAVAVALSTLTIVFTYSVSIK